MLLVLYGREGEIGGDDVVRFGAGAGIRGDVQDAVRVVHSGGGIVPAVGVLILVRGADGVQPVHHIGAAVDMVVALKHYVDVQLLQDGHELGLEAGGVRDVIVLRVAGHSEEGVMEHGDLPLNVLIGGRGDRLLHKLPVLGDGHVVAVEHEEEHLVVDEVAVAACGGGAKGVGLVGNVEVLPVSVGAGVVVAHDGGRRESGEHIVVEVAVILVLVRCAVDLIACGEEEGHVGEVFVAADQVQRFIPSKDVALGAARADLRVAHVGEGEGTGLSGGKGVDSARLACVGQLIVIGNAGLEILDGDLAALLAVVGGDRRGVVDLRAGHRVVRRDGEESLPVEHGVPGEAHLALVCAHGQADVGLIVYGFVGKRQLGQAEEDVGAAAEAVVQLDRHGVHALAQGGKCVGVDDLKILLHGVAARDVGAVATVGIAALGIESRGPNAVEIDDRGIVILDMSDELGHLRELLRSERNRRAEVIGGIVGVITGASNEEGIRAVVQGAFLGAEGALSRFPLGIVKAGCGPAGADIAIGARSARRIGVVVQIGPGGGSVDQGRLRRQGLGGEGQTAGHGEPDVRAARAFIVYLHGDGVDAIDQVERGYVGNLDVAGGVRLLAAIAAVGVTAVVVEAGGTDAVDVQDGGVIILDAADDLRNGGGIRDAYLRAEVVGGIVVTVPVCTTNAVKFVGRTVGGDPFVGFLAAEGTAGRLPAGIVEAGRGPAGTGIALGGWIARGIAVVVQISPDGRVVNLSGCLCVFL